MMPPAPAPAPSPSHESARSLESAIGGRHADPLDAAVIRVAVEHAGVRLERLDVVAETDSTNRQLLERAPPAPGRLAVCIADYQSAGRGRRGRRWQMPPGAGLCLSVAWRVARPGQLSTLPLAVGVIARRAIRSAAGVDVAIKWPNDLVWRDAKLGGVLIERAGPADAPYVVVGIGINVDVPPDVLAGLSDWPAGAVDLAAATSGVPPPRNRLAAELIAGLAALARTSPCAGLAAYRAELDAADWLRGQHVVAADGAIAGVAEGIDADGALRVRTADDRIERLVSNDVSVRTVRAAGPGEAAG